MTPHSLRIDYIFHPADGSTLCSDDRELLHQAQAATQRSYAPYSQFHVGAAVRLENGDIVCGNNQENAAYPAGTCAERCALHFASASQPDLAPTTIAVAAWRKETARFVPTPITPCGICRQVLLETEQRYSTPIRVLLHGESGIYEIASASQLLPFHFDGSAL